MLPRNRLRTLKCMNSDHALSSSISVTEQFHLVLTLSLVIVVLSLKRLVVFICLPLFSHHCFYIPLFLLGSISFIKRHIFQQFFSQSLCMVNSVFFVKTSLFCPHPQIMIQLGIEFQEAALFSQSLPYIFLMSVKLSFFCR